LIRNADSSEEIEGLWKEFKKGHRGAITSKRELIDLARRVGLLEELLNQSGNKMEKRILNAVAEDAQVS
jgi:hypothetical protein